MTSKLNDLLARARKRAMSPSEREDQRRSFAYGNAAIENSRVTREMIERIAERGSVKSPKAKVVQRRSR